MTRSVPLGVPALVGVAGLAAVLTTGPHLWQLLVSAALALLLLGTDAWRVWTAARA